jgi:hypothetical protein
MTPIERAARALCALDGHPENAKMDGKRLWQDYLPEVRAVLEAIREPSAKMEEAANADQALFIGAPKPIWQQMVDAALAEDVA